MFYGILFVYDGQRGAFNTMASDRMYELAFQYKKTKLWKKLYDSEIFALKLSDGEIGYCCVMGMAGQVNAISLYVGEKGFQKNEENRGI